MIKKILIGIVGVIALVFVVIYFMVQPTLEDDGSYSARIDREDIEIFADLGPTALLLYLNDRYLKDQGDYYLLDGNDVYYFIYDVLGDQYYNTLEDFEADNPDNLYFQIYLEDGVVTKMEGYEGLEMYLLIEVYYE